MTSAAPAPKLHAYLRGIGLWTPSHASFDAWVGAGMPDALDSDPPDASASARPPAELLHPRLRRRTSVLTRATVTALEAAGKQAGVGLDQLRFVLVSSFGEIETTVELLAQLGSPQGPVSPTKFHNSVHNTATGYMSIASGNHRESTALAGGPHNLEIAALELLAGIAADASSGDAVLLVAEERLPAPFTRADGDPTFALALHFSHERAGPDQPDSLDLRVRLEPTLVQPSGDEPLGLPSMAPTIIRLARAIARLVADPSGPATVVELSSRPDPSVDLRWDLHLEHS